MHARACAHTHTLSALEINQTRLDNLDNSERFTCTIHQTGLSRKLTIVHALFTHARDTALAMPVTC